MSALRCGLDRVLSTSVAWNVAPPAAYLMLFTMDQEVGGRKGPTVPRGSVLRGALFEHYLASWAAGTARYMPYRQCTKAWIMLRSVPLGG